jgi:hypothetical protein
MEERERGIPVEQVAPPIGLEEQPIPTEEWKPSRQECLRDYEVKIRFLTLGCIVSVGCKEIPFTTIKEGMEALNEYVARPYESQQAWEKRFQEEEK